MRRIKGERDPSEERLDLETALMRPWPGLKADDAKRILAEARARLHVSLVEAIRSSGAQNCGAALEPHFVQYAKAILMQVSERVEARDAETCLQELKTYLIPLIVRAVEPDRAHHRMTYGTHVNDTVGEWEVRLAQAYAAHRAEQGPSEADTPFRYNYIFRLRNQAEREMLRDRLENGLTLALIEVEGRLRARLPAQKATVSRARGVAPAVADHILVAGVLHRLGEDWGRRLSEVCQALQNAQAAFPRRWEQERLQSWTDVAEWVADDSSLEREELQRRRQRVRDYLRHAEKWVRARTQKLHRQMNKQDPRSKPRD